jgi:protein gp37
MTDLWHESLEVDGPALTLLAQEVESLRTGCRAHNQVVMFLTKRPERLLEWQQLHFPNGLPPQAWVGTTAEDQSWADKRIPHLIQVEADVRYLSCEPMVGGVVLRPEWLSRELEWVIAGGESGSKARRNTAEPSWFRSLMDQCDKADIPFFFKQWGAHDEVGKRVGKKTAGCELDGCERKEWPGTWGPFRRTSWNLGVTP